MSGWWQAVACMVMKSAMAGELMEAARKSSVPLNVGRADTSLFRSALLVGGFCLLTALAAQVRIPVPGTLIPMTLQAPVVLLAAFMLSPGKAVASALLYVGLGAVGAPVFAPGSLGLAGPTGGFLVGFVLCAWIVGMLCREKPASAVRLFVSGLVGYVVLFVLGLTWNGVWMGDLGLSFRTGFPPFFPKAVVEIGLTVAVALASTSVLRRFGPAADRSCSGG